MFGGIKPKYTEVPKDETISIDNESDSWSQESPKIRQMPHFLGIGPVSWSLLSAFLLLLLVYQEYYYRGRYWKGAYDTGFHTEYGTSGINFSVLYSPALSVCKSDFFFEAHHELLLSWSKFNSAGPWHMTTQAICSLTWAKME